MPLKKKTFNNDEEQIFDDAVIIKRGDYWQFRMWLTKERKYARFSLKTRASPIADTMGARNVLASGRLSRQR